MALMTFVLACDHCPYESEDLADRDEVTKDECLEQATELGWYVVRGPQRELGWDGEKIFCSLDCLIAGLT